MSEFIWSPHRDTSTHMFALPSSQLHAEDRVGRFDVHLPIASWFHFSFVLVECLFSVCIVLALRAAAAAVVVAVFSLLNACLAYFTVSNIDVCAIVIKHMRLLFVVIVMACCLVFSCVHYFCLLPCRLVLIVCLFVRIDFVCHLLRR